jgi:HAE1 family hydrophobic/amphiphilic exporter-1
MIASTCLAVLFVPTFFVVVQRFENWRAERKKKVPDAQTVSRAGS